LPAVQYTTDTVPPKPDEPFVLRPSFALGIGMLSFFGDHNENHVSNPQYGRLGYDLFIAQKLSSSLSAGLYVLFGKVAANTQTASTHFNFESQIRTGGLNVEYNFDQLFKKKDRKISPWFSLGIESLEFLSKTDMRDANGNLYYYWNDGSIRNMAQNSPGSGHAILLHRDYTYETDIRELNKNGYGKYREQCIAFPIGAGVLFHLSPKVEFKIGTTFHFTLTDYIDGIPASDAGKGTHYDKFFMTSFALRYNLFDDASKKDGIDPHIYDGVDMTTIETEDSDGDGVPDIRDSCAGTPAGVPVDLKGCPLDGDGDGVPDYLDKELDSKPLAIVNKDGVTMSDTLISENWDRFMDSTGKYTLHVTLPPGGDAGYHPKGNKKEYAVLLGTFRKGLSTEKMSKFLSIEDIRSTNLDDSTTAYTAGKFDNVLDAEKRKGQLVGEGMTDAKVVYLKDGRFIEPEKVFNTDGIKEKTPKEGIGKDNGTKAGTKDGSKEGSKEGSKNGTKEGSKSGSKEGGSKDGTKNGSKGTKENNPIEPKDKGESTTEVKGVPATPGVVFRIQLGAFKHRIGANTFADAGNVLELKTEDGLYKYMSGSFSTFDAAAKHKVEMISKGYQGAFIAAFKNGKRVALTDVGAIPAEKASRAQSDSDAVNSPAVKKELIVFKVQMGAFKAEPPAELKAKFATIKNVEQSTTSAGLTRYTAGSFHDYASAQKLKEELKKQGIEGAFVISFFKNELISVQEAQELLKQ
jgi:cell division septation protein DedD